GGSINKIMPKFDCSGVRNQFALAGILKENTPNRTVGLQAAENVPARAVEKIGDSAQNLSLGALARTGGAEQQDCAIFHITPDMSVGQPKVPQNTATAQIFGKRKGLNKF